MIWNDMEWYEMIGGDMDSILWSDMGYIGASQSRQIQYWRHMQVWTIFVVFACRTNTMVLGNGQNRHGRIGQSLPEGLLLGPRLYTDYSPYSCLCIEPVKNALYRCLIQMAVYVVVCLPALRACLLCLGWVDCVVYRGNLDSNSTTPQQERAQTRDFFLDTFYCHS